MKTFREFLLKSEKLSNNAYIQICNLVIEKNYPEIVDYDLKRITKEEALSHTESIIFVKCYNPKFYDIFWYCCHPNGFNYYIPDSYVLDGYARMTREKCIQHAIDWIEVVKK